MSFMKKTALTGALSLGLVAAPMTQSAQLAVDVDITLPSIIILYAYTDINLTLGAGVLSSFVSGGTCATDDCALDEGTTTGVISALNGNLDLTISSTITAVPTTNPTVTLENSWGVRGLGFTTYNESVVNAGTSEIAGVTIDDLASVTPSFALTTGDAVLTLDISDLDGTNDNGIIEANYTITVTGS